MPFEIRRATFHDLDVLVPLFDGYRRFYGKPSDEAGARDFLTARLCLGESMLLHSRPNDPVNPRPYGVCAVIFHAMSAQVSVNGKRAKGRAWPRERMGRPYSTCLVGFSESWTEPR